MSDHKELQFVANAIGILSALFVFVSFATVYWMLWIDHDPPFHSDTVKVLDSSGQERYTYRAGEPLTIVRDFCVTKTMSVTIGRQFRNVEDNTGVNMDTTSQTLKAGCRSGGNIILLPWYMPPGKYRYDVSVHYPDNALRDEVAELTPTLIEIRP